MTNKEDSVGVFICRGWFQSSSLIFHFNSSKVNFTRRPVTNYVILVHFGTLFLSVFALLQIPKCTVLDSLRTTYPAVLSLPLITVCVLSPAVLLDVILLFLSFLGSLNSPLFSERSNAFLDLASPIVLPISPVYKLAPVELSDHCSLIFHSNVYCTGNLVNWSIFCTCTVTRHRLSSLVSPK